MNIAILSIVLLSAATATAKTTIIEYPDHYYVESVGISDGKPASRVDSVPSAKAPSAPIQESSDPVATPVTNFDATRQPVDPVERRASMERELERLQREHRMLSVPQEGETSDQANRRQQEAQGKLRKINKILSELTKMP